MRFNNTPLGHSLQVYEPQQFGRCGDLNHLFFSVCSQINVSCTVTPLLTTRKEEENPNKSPEFPRYFF